MPEQSIKDKTAIAGVGWTKFSKASGTTVLNLAAEACLNAVEDAGISVHDVDGMIASYLGNEWERQAYPREVVRALGMKDCNYQMYEILGGSQTCSYIVAAAMAIYSGACSNVLVFRALNRFSDRGGRRGELAQGPCQWHSPVGELHAAASFGPHVVAHMAKYGTTSIDMAHLAVTQHNHALLNKKSMMTKPLTVEDHQASPWIVYALHLFDCCLNTDGAVAVLVTSAERARDMRQAPVYIMSMLGGVLDGEKMWETNAERAAPKLYGGAWITADDVNFAELYDPFTGMCLLHMEGFGLTEPGTSGAWVRAGGNTVDGAIPVNTHGGLLSEAYLHGLNHVVEAVQQLRPGGVVDDYCDGPHDYDRSHCRQLQDAEIGLVCGEMGHSELILRRA